MNIKLTDRRGLAFYAHFNPELCLWEGTCPQFPDTKCYAPSPTDALDMVKAVVDVDLKEQEKAAKGE